MPKKSVCVVKSVLRISLRMSEYPFHFQRWQIWDLYVSHYVVYTLNSYILLFHDSGDRGNQNLIMKKEGTTTVVNKKDTWILEYKVMELTKEN